MTRAAHNVAPDDPFWDKVALGQWRLIGPRLAGVIVFLADELPADLPDIEEIKKDFTALASWIDGFKKR